MSMKRRPTVRAALAKIVNERWCASSNHATMKPMQKRKRADTIADENGLSYSVRIDATFGTQFQRSVAVKNLNGLLTAWKELVGAKHKNNAVSVIVGTD
jgi:hypothetical protein